MERLLPLFPLRLVIFPGSAVPLHIFENRYREMVGEAALRGTEFGIVLSLDEGLANVGCTVVVDSIVEKYPDGRFDIIARGKRRFQLNSIDQEKAYLRGEVTFFDDDDAEIPAPALRREALAAFQLLESDREITLPEHPTLSFLLADAIDDIDFRAMIQRSLSETERLRLFIQTVPKYLERQKYAEKMKKAAPTNGFGHKPAG